MHSFHQKTCLILRCANDSSIKIHVEWTVTFAHAGTERRTRNLRFAKSRILELAVRISNSFGRDYANVLHFYNLQIAQCVMGLPLIILSDLRDEEFNVRESDYSKIRKSKYSLCYKFGSKDQKCRMEISPIENCRTNY